MRVTTNYQNQNSLRQLQDANEKIALSSYQITTGNKAEKLSQLSGEAYSLLNMKDIQSNTDSYLTNIDTATQRLRATETALTQMTDLLSEAAQVYTAGRNENSADTRAALAPEAQALAESFYGIFKTEFDNQYIFSGSNGTQAPINGTAAAAVYPGDPLPTTYYQGDSRQQQIITGAGTTQSYGITGDNEAFAYLKSGLEALMYGLENNDTTEIDNAVAALEKSQDALSNSLGNIGGQINSLNLISERHNNQQSFLNEQIEDIEKVDVTEALTEFTQQQATLEASMLTITRINQISLLDFL